MIILTTPAIKNYDPVKVSSIVEYAGTKWCLAEMKDDNTSLPQTEEELEETGLDFWWEVGNNIHASINDYRRSYKFHGGMIEAIEWFIGLSKPNNIAGYIGTYCNAVAMDPFVLWERQIIKKKKKKK